MHICLHCNLKVLYFIWFPLNLVYEGHIRMHYYKHQSHADLEYIVIIMHVRFKNYINCEIDVKRQYKILMCLHSILKLGNKIPLLSVACNISSKRLQF